jgi:protein-disulfide isomerase
MKRFFTACAMMLLFSTAAGAADRVTVDVGERPFLGAADAPVTIVEFLDFQ